MSTEIQESSDEADAHFQAEDCNADACSLPAVGDSEPIIDEKYNESKATNDGASNEVTVAEVEVAEVEVAEVEVAEVEVAEVEAAEPKDAPATTVETATVETATVETATVETATVETATVETATPEPEIAADSESEVVATEPVATEPVATEPDVVEAVAENAFRKLGLSESLVKAVEASGYTQPTPIQEQTIPYLLQGRDVVGQAQTGTGKTAAFALPLLDRIDQHQNKTQVIVLTPTRELAIQVADSFEKYSKMDKAIRVAAVYGGQDYQIQFRQLNRGVHVVVGTPGRVMDHMRRGTLKLDKLQCLVLDEADEMLRMGFAEDVKWILTETPDTRQVALFSATMPAPIRQIAQKHLHTPAEITIKQKTATADTVNQRYVVTSPHQKQEVLARILEAEPVDGVLVFVKTRSTTEPLAEYLTQAGLSAAALNGDIAQKQRERIVERLRSGHINVIVATDVAARGLDVQRISHVVNYDLPYDSEAYVHRIGRTGRAGRSGEAILFVHPRERRWLERLEYTTRQKIEPMALPTNREINKQRVAKFHEKITEALGKPEIDVFKSVIEQYRRDHDDVPVELIAAALAVMAAGESPMLVKDELRQTNFADKGSKGNNRRNESQTNRGEPYRGSDSNKVTYRVEVGRKHQIQPGNLVGAIANEANLSREAIGKIKIFDQYSTVDLPQDMSQDLFNVISNIFVKGKKLDISRSGATRVQVKRGKHPFAKPYNKSKNSNGSKGGGKGKPHNKAHNKPHNKAR